MIDLDDIGYLYIIEDIKYGTGFLKVGKTTNPLRRLRQYNSSFPEDRITYRYLSEKLYNLSECENLLLDYLTVTEEGLIRSKNEWFKHPRKQNKANLIERIIKKIEAITDTYYQEEYI